MAHYSFAMDNAAENIKQIARYATDNNKHEGALNVIQAVLKIKCRLHFNESRGNYPDFSMSITLIFFNQFNH